jgi:hypothetical protein
VIPGGISAPSRGRRHGRRSCSSSQPTKKGAGPTYGGPGQKAGPEGLRACDKREKPPASTRYLPFSIACPTGVRLLPALRKAGSLPLSTEPPYKPGYGLEPPLLVGRDRLLAWTWEALVAGPTHPDFHQALLGERGVGKTVVAQLIASRTKAQLGWAVLDYHAIAGEASLPALVHELPGALGAWSRRGREFRQLEKQLSVGVNIGVLSASTTLRSNTKGGPARERARRAARTGAWRGPVRRSAVRRLGRTTSWPVYLGPGQLLVQSY